MVEIFKTNVQEKSEAKLLVGLLLGHLPENKINFDLDDCDKILRVEGENIEPVKVMMLVRSNGFDCEVLE